MDTFLAFAERVGVPTFLCCVVVYRIENRLEHLTTAIIDLARHNACPLTKEN